MVFFHLIQKYLKSFARDHVNDVNNNIEGVFEVEAYRAPDTAFLFDGFIRRTSLFEQKRRRQVAHTLQLYLKVLMSE
jgi:hypothetical protein